MSVRPKFRHSSLYYRNLMIASGLFVFTFGVALVRGVEPASFLWFLPLLLLNYFVWVNFGAVHPSRRRQPHYTPKDIDQQYEIVDFPSRDGLRLTGWYIPSRNRAAVVLAHGAGGSKAFMINHAHFLALEGYGVLLVDLRAHGESEGDTINGVDEANDVLGAVDFLRRRADVDRERIGALGVSLGALTVLRAAARSETIRAVVLDSLGPLCLEDHGGRPTSLRRWVNYPFNWFFYSLGDFFAGMRVSEGVRALLPRLAPRPVMLIAAGRYREAYFNRLFYDWAGEPKSLWEVPRAHHAAAIVFEPGDYRERVRNFFKRSLLL